MENRRYGQDQDQEFKEKVVQIRRVTKVVTGGKKMSFRALVVVGDKKARVGIGLGKANEVSAAIRKAVEAAKKNLVTVIMVGSTLPHEIVGKFGASNVLLRPAPKGRGVIAGGSVRTILELAGVKDVVSKSIGSSNAINNAYATINGLKELKDINKEEEKRSKKIDVKFVGQ